MKGEGLFSISDFAKLTRTTRDTLLYYDSIGLLSPTSRGKNKYRLYSREQLGDVNLIRTCQALGMSLTQIKNLKKHRTPELMAELLEQQAKQINEKIDEWVCARKLTYVLKKIIHTALSAETEAITIQFLPAEAIILGELNDYSQGKSDYDALLTFYHACHDKYPGIDLNYPVWGMFSEEQIKQRDWVYPDRFYFYNPEGFDKKPAGLYAIGYGNDEYGQSTDLYERMLDYIDANGFEICGPTYEEYPLNEISVLEEKNYLMRLMITVREKQHKRNEGSTKQARHPPNRAAMKSP